MQCEDNDEGEVCTCPEPPQISRPSVIDMKMIRPPSPGGSTASPVSTSSSCSTCSSTKASGTFKGFSFGVVQPPPGFSKRRPLRREIIKEETEDENDSDEEEEEPIEEDDVRTPETNI